jgi:hypothetical protein
MRHLEKTFTEAYRRGKAKQNAEVSRRQYSKEWPGFDFCARFVCCIFEQFAIINTLFAVHGIQKQLHRDGRALTDNAQTGMNAGIPRRFLGMFSFEDLAQKWCRMKRMDKQRGEVS